VIMKCKSIFLGLSLTLFALPLFAIDLGGHVGYFDNDVKKAYIGADLSVPVGPVAIMPTVDYWKEHGVGYWIGSGDVVLRWAESGHPAFWLGAGPAYGYLTGYDSGSGSGVPAHGLQYTPGPGSSGSSEYNGFGNGKDNAWGWDVTGGVTFGAMGGVRPYVTGRYDKVKELKAGGVAIGIRFGH